MSLNNTKNFKLIDLFAGTGAFSYVFEKYSNIECIFANDMVDESEEIYNLNHKIKLTNKDLNDIKIENVPDHNILCAGFNCFIEGTKILTNKGYINIEDITLEDKVLTHTGNFQNILNLQRNIYSNNIYTFKIKYHYRDIICTEEHPFYIRQKIRKWNNSIRRYEYTFTEPKWELAKNIHENHYFSMIINTNNIIPSFTFENNDKNYDIILDNIDMWYMMGYFIGDGWIEETSKKSDRCMNKIRFIINTKDEEYVVERIRKILPITDKKNKSSKNCKVFGCCDFVWFNILKQFGKYAHGKKIPEWLQDSPKEYIQEFINGYMKADGCINKDNSHQITTVSLDLALGTQRLYLKLGHIFSVIKFIRSPTTIIEGRVVNQRDTYKIIGWLNKVRNCSSFIEDNYVWYKSYSIKNNMEENKYVYNFEVENDNSYIVENIITHNCQPFSIAGKQKGFEDTRTDAFWSMINIIKNKNPEIIILENVKNLCSHNEGKSFEKIINTLEEIGYNIKWEVLNTSKITSIPQNRERIYIIGFLNKDYYDKFNFDFDIIENVSIKSLLDLDIDKKYYYTDKIKNFNEFKKNITKNIDENVLYQYRRFYFRENKSGVCPTLTANMGTGGHNVPLLLDNNGIRKLTPSECFKLQGFPSNFKLPKISDSKLYKLSGNAVSIPIIELIAKKIYNIIN